MKDVGVPFRMPLDLRRLVPLLSKLTPAERGAIITLLAAAWNAESEGEPACTIPANPTAIARLIGGPYAEVDAAVRAQFKPTNNGSDRLVCRWLLADYEAVMASRKYRINAGRKGAEVTNRGRKRGVVQPPKPQPLGGNAAATLRQDEEEETSSYKAEGAFPLDATPSPATVGEQGDRATLTGASALPTSNGKNPPPVAPPPSRVETLPPDQDTGATPGTRSLDALDWRQWLTVAGVAPPSRGAPETPTPLSGDVAR